MAQGIFSPYFQSIKQIHNITGQSFKLLPQKAIFWEEGNTLIISDLHLGKSHHFRKSGVAVPKEGDYENLRMLKGLLNVHQPDRLLLMGDLFHSDANSHVLEVMDFLKDFNTISFELVAGNHDIMHESWYKALQMTVHDEYHIEGPFIFSHEPMLPEDIPDNYYNICGHIHPGIKLRGKARQVLVLPCFYFGSRQGILPAFGKFTGLYKVKPEKEDSVYAVVERSVVKLA